VYFSGGVASVPATLHVARGLFADRCLVGSSGGALLAAFLSLRREERGEKRDFLNLCGRVAKMYTWSEVYGALRGWVRDVTGGAACTMRQWCAKRAFSPVLYDFERRRPVVVGPGKHSVAYVLACCVLRDAPARSLPALPEPWIDVETVLHPSLLSRAIVPPVALHFTSCLDRGLRPGPGDVMGLQEQALHAPPCSLTWNVPLPHGGASLLPSALLPSRWPGLLSLRWSQAAATASAEDRVVFALGFLAWALLGLVLERESV
jgi:hypothetical protein